MTENANTKMTADKARAAITEASSINDLYAALVDIEEACEELEGGALLAVSDVVDSLIYGDFPTFGGPPPLGDLPGKPTYSWDAGRLLVRSDRGWEIIERPEAQAREDIKASAEIDAADYEGGRDEIETVLGDLIDQEIRDGRHYWPAAIAGLGEGEARRLYWQAVMVWLAEADRAGVE